MALETQLQKQALSTCTWERATFPSLKQPRALGPGECGREQGAGGSRSGTDPPASQLPHFCSRPETGSRSSQATQPTVRSHCGDYRVTSGQGGAGSEQVSPRKFQSRDVLWALPGQHPRRGPGLQIPRSLKGRWPLFSPLHLHLTDCTGVQKREAGIEKPALWL